MTFAQLCVVWTSHCVTVNKGTHWKNSITHVRSAGILWKCSDWVGVSITVQWDSPPMEGSGTVPTVLKLARDSLLSLSLRGMRWAALEGHISTLVSCSLNSVLVTVLLSLTRKSGKKFLSVKWICLLLQSLSHSLKDWYESRAGLLYWLILHTKTASGLACARQGACFSSAAGFGQWFTCMWGEWLWRDNQIRISLFHALYSHWQKKPLSFVKVFDL